MKTQTGESRAKEFNRKPRESANLGVRGWGERDKTLRESKVKRLERAR